MHYRRSDDCEFLRLNYSLVMKKAATTWDNGLSRVVEARRIELPLLTWGNSIYARKLRDAR